MRTRVRVLLMVLMFGLTMTGRSSGQTVATAPPQPTTGPGGSNYAYGSVTVNGPYWAAGHAGDDTYRYFIYEPAQPTPAVAPVVLFLHGWLSYDPNDYGGWLVHMARKGYTVVWVQYDTLNIPWSFATAASVAWKDALARLNNTAEAHVRPARTAAGAMKTAYVGHSAGAYVGAIMAVRATRYWNNMPKPFAIVAIEPGGGSGLIPGDDFSKIDPSTNMVLVVGDEDNIVCSDTATKLWDSTPQILDPQKDYLYVISDTHGQPLQLATHFFPNTSGQWDTAAVDARDFFVTWKLSVATLNCTFNGTDCTTALGNGSPSQINMGTWSDGLPLNKMQWVPVPDLLPRSAVCVGKKGA